MPRRYRIAAGLLSLWLWVLPAFGQILSDEAESTVPPMPDLAALKTGWWDYFSAEKPGAADRHAAFIAKLREEMTGLDPVRRDEAERRIELLSSNLEAYLELAGRPGLSPQPIPAESDRYTLEQLLRLLDAARVAERLVADDELEVSRAERRRDIEKRRREQAFKEYIAAEDVDERWLRGLRLVQARSQLALAEVRLQLVSADLANAREYREGLGARLRYARNRLSVPADDAAIEAAAKKVRAADAALIAARTALDEAELKSAGFDLSTETGKAEQRVQQQQALRARVLYARAQLAKMQAEAEWFLTRVFGDNRPSLATLKEKETEWEQIDEDLSTNLDEWRQDLEAEILLVQGTPRDDVDDRLRRLLDQRVAVAAETLALIGEVAEAQLNFRFTVQVLDEAAANRVSRFKRWLGVGYAGLLAGWRWLGGIGQQTLFTLGDTPITWGTLFTVLLWLLAATLISKLVRQGLQRVAETGGLGDSAGLYTFGRLFHYVIIVLAFFFGLASVGVDFSSIALIAGALGVGIGFGLQNIVNNFVSGLIILFEGSLRVGDYIELDTGVTGTVKAIDARSTLINTNDNIDIIVPNGEIASNKLTNWTLAEYVLRMRIPFGVEYGTDKELVRKAAIEAANNVHYTLKNLKGREPEVWLVEFGDSSLNFLLLVWVNRQGARRPTRTRAAYLWELDNVFAKYGITVPFPQRDLHLRSGFQRLSPPDGE